MSQPLNDNTWTDQVRIAIRYLASGFVSIIVLNQLGIKEDLIPHYEDSVWYSIIVGSVLGILIYAFHAAIGDDFFYRFALRSVIRNKERDFYLPPQFFEFEDSREVNYNWFKRTFWRIEKEKEKLSKLYEFRLCREGTNNPKLSAIQRRLDQNLSLMAFLYASSYSLIFIPLFYSLFLILKYVVNGQIEFMEFSSEYIFLIFIGLTLLLIGLVLDAKVTKWEMWFIKNYQSDSECDKNLFKEDTVSTSGIGKLQIKTRKVFM